jgi:hypothetical protein
VIDVSERFKSNSGYFDKVHHEISNGGLSAMLHDLQNIDLGKWHPRQIVRTEALRQQKIRTMAPLDEWWESLLQIGYYPLIPVSGTDNMMPATGLLNVARDSHPKLRDISATAFGRFLTSHKCEGLHRRTGEFWEFPALSLAKNDFEQKYGKWRWENDINDWSVRKP